MVFWSRTVTDRITIRINGLSRQLLEDRCQRTGQSVSETVRCALHVALGTNNSVCQSVETTQAVQRGAINYNFPGELSDLLPRYRAFGMQIYAERRRSVAALLAACEIVREHSGNAQDRALCAEILRIGRQFGLLR